MLVEAIFSADGKATREEQLAALVHDAPEYVVGDMISPFKAVMGGDYKAVEHRLLSAIHLRFGLKAHVPQALTKRIKQADQIAAYLEATQLAGFDEDEAVRLFGQPPVILAGYTLLIKPWTADEAKARFMERFLEVEAR